MRSLVVSMLILRLACRQPRLLVGAFTARPIPMTKLLVTQRWMSQDNGGEQQVQERTPEDMERIQAEREARK